MIDHQSCINQHLDPSFILAQHKLVHCDLEMESKVVAVAFVLLLMTLGESNILIPHLYILSVEAENSSENGNCS